MVVKNCASQNHKKVLKLTLMQTTSLKLQNGLRVLLLDTETFPSLTSLLLVGAGSRYETPQNNGIAHFFEHMAFKGSTKYPTALSISTLLDSLGSQQNAFTGKDHTGYWIKAPVEHFATVLDVLSDMVLHSLLKTEEIEREKGVIVEEINMYEDQPQYKVWDLFESLIFPQNPLGYSTTGTKATVSSFSRATFTSYMSSLYRPANAVLVLAGGIGSREAAIREQIEAKFGKWESQDTLPFAPVSWQQMQAQTLFFSKKTEQAHFVLGYPALSRGSEERYVLSLLAAILGGGMSSRLFYELRERRGLCYYISTGVELYEETGYFYTRAGVNVSRDKIEEAIALIIKEQHKIIKGEVKAEELTRAKEMLKGRTVLSMEDSQHLANFFGSKLLFGQKEDSLKKILAKIDKVTLGEIVGLANRIIEPNKLNLTVISPHKSLTY
jgi:predicted Zn-dependent peptidase